MAQKLKARPGVAKYEEGVKPLKMKKDAGVQPDEKVRQTFLVQIRDIPEWSVLKAEAAAAQAILDRHTTNL